MNYHTASLEITVNVHESVLSRKRVLWTNNWKHVIKYNLYGKFPRLFAHNVQINAKFCRKNFNDVCQVFRILHHYTWGGGRLFVDTLYTCLTRRWPHTTSDIMYWFDWQAADVTALQRDCRSPSELRSPLPTSPSFDVRLTFSSVMQICFQHLFNRTIDTRTHTCILHFNDALFRRTFVG